MYRRITSMPKFDDGFSYMLEFGLQPLSVLQLRRFRRKENGEGIKCSWANNNNVISSNFTFGLTDTEGISVPFYTGGMLPGPNPRTKDWNDEMHDFNDAHQEGFLSTLADSWYANTYFPNWKVGVKDTFAHSIHHGMLESLATLPNILFNPSRRVEEPEFNVGSQVRVFSNGREGYLLTE
jgi:hypothetical protein